MLVSPAEPKYLRDLGTVSSQTEGVGADFLIFSQIFGCVGIQRKEMNDLVASVNVDDRLAREVISLKELDHAIWIIEGKPQWSTDGQLMSTRTRYTHSQHLGLLFTLSFQGFLLFFTDTMQETGELLLLLEKWLQKEKHNGTNHRGAARGNFGQASTSEQQIFFLQGLPGIGYDRAEAIINHFGGLPLELTGDIGEVAGIGIKTRDKIRRIFE